MRLKANIDEMRWLAHELRAKAKKRGDTQAADYYQGVFVALGWVQDKKNEETNILIDSK